MNEYLIIVVFLVNMALFSLGGTIWKPLRRHFMPIFIAVIAVLSHIVIWKAVVVGLMLIVSLSCGYGERSGYLKKFLIFCGYGLPFLLIGWSMWCVLTPFILTAVFFLSNWKPTERMFLWKFCEIFMGFIISLCFVSCLMASKG